MIERCRVLPDLNPNTELKGEALRNFKANVLDGVRYIAEEDYSDFSSSNQLKTPQVQHIDEQTGEPICSWLELVRYPDILFDLKRNMPRYYYQVTVCRAVKRPDQAHHVPYKTDLRDIWYVSFHRFSSLPKKDFRVETQAELWDELHDTREVMGNLLYSPARRYTIGHATELMDSIVAIAKNCP